MISKLGNRKIERKLQVYDYLCILIDWIRENKASAHKFNRVAEIEANKAKITRKEKEIVIELLDVYYPLPKPELGDFSNKVKRAAKLKEKSASRENMASPLARGGNLALIGGELLTPRLELMEPLSKKRVIKDDGSSSSMRNMSLENLVKRARSIIPDLKSIYKSFEGDSPKFTSSFAAINGLNVTISQAFSTAKIENIIGLNIYDVLTLPKYVGDEMNVRYTFDHRSIIIRNVSSEEQVLYHGIATFQHYDSLESIELINTQVPPSILELLFELAAVLSPRLESVTIRSVKVTPRVAESISAAILPHLKIKNLCLSHCGLDTKDVGNIVTGIVRGHTVENLDLSKNLLGTA